MKIPGRDEENQGEDGSAVLVNHNYPTRTALQQLLYNNCSTTSAPQQLLTTSAPQQVLHNNYSTTSAPQQLATESELTESSVSEFHEVPKSRLDARPPGGAKYRATAKSELTEFYREFPDVAKSVGEARPPEGADPLVLRAVERLLDMVRCLERLRKRLEQVEEEERTG